MAIRFDCPRCKQPLSVPNKKAGSYASCPRCQGRFWVPKDAPTDQSPADVVAPPVVMGLHPAHDAAGSEAPASPSGTASLRSAPAPLPLRASPAPMAAPPSVARPAAPPPSSVAAPPVVVAASGTPAAAAAPPVAAVVSPPAPAPQGGTTAPPSPPRKAARLVSAEAAQSNLKIAADGQLPHLQLQETEKKDKSQGKNTTVHPAVLLGFLMVSIVMSIILALADIGSSASSAARRKAEALDVIEKQYFGNPEHGQLARYQVYLREAKQAQCRGDRKTERQYYRKVLDLLCAELHSGASAGSKQAAGFEPGLTGSRARDRELETQISILLSDR